ncbi:ABC transporter ATP-binding protein [Desulfovirgula thermocuniculi]|uniref:ABC transporter ATP-binding protein n=1 Tax=Desulfovirgula thermocuniculi TaxID=348842 RepID=UPI0005506CC7|nr:dipeptide/oligopeptide/nickel ABC transporter ATP-binding protein [Desulfovirgula thermocuniculi]
MLLVLKGVVKHFRVGRERQEVLAGVNLGVGRGEVVALVGASGAGKTTLLHIIAGLLAADGGEAFFAGRPLALRETRQGREQMSLVFQDPYAALSPHLKVADIVGEPLFIRRKPRQNVARAVTEALHAVGLHPAEAYLRRYPHQLSGGQRQRVALARALVTKPTLLLADEPTSMLDVSVGVEILNLLRSLAEKGMSILLTAHDLAAACYVADRLAIMAEGQVVEEGPPARLLAAPSRSATRELLRAVT